MADAKDSTNGGRPLIFISYAHEDRTWLEYVRSFFEPLTEHWMLTIWDDQKLRIGDDWKGDIYSALDACDVFLILVSRYSLASNFIKTEEVPRVVARPSNEVQLCPLVVTPYYSKPLEWLDRPNRRPPDGKALSELADPARDREMAEIAKQIDEIVTEAASRRGIVKTPTPSRTRPLTFTFPSIVDFGRLPETPYKALVGRDDELKRLDDAWNDDKTNIMSLIARGGAGKTSLVVEWLRRVREDGYRGADAVLGWSFFSQGTKEHAASGEGFIDWALGKLKVKVDTTSATVKGERLAEELSRRHVLMVLDGLEPLQFGPEGQQGAFKDQGLRSFLRGLAMKPATQSLVVLTSQVAVADLKKWTQSTAPVIDLIRLSDEAGAALLMDRGVKGTDDDLQATTHEFAGHGLALSLLAGYLSQLYGGDVKERLRIRAVKEDDNGDDQAIRVLEALYRDWLSSDSILTEIMFVVGLFDRPASADCVAALRRKPFIDGLNDALVWLDDEYWSEAVAKLRAARLLDPEDATAPDALDVHPLVREWFGERLKATNEKAWREAHGRLYEHLRDSTEEGDTPTLGDFAPLYQAIGHGCRARRYQEAMNEVYVERICRFRGDGRLEFYSRDKLGAFGSELAALSWFFDKLYDVPAGALNKTEQSWLLGEAAFLLRVQGRFAEALAGMRAALTLDVNAEDWQNAAVTAANLGASELLVGSIAAAVAMAETAVACADRSGDEFEKVARRTDLADALQAAGRCAEAEALFADAEQRQRQRDSHHSLLYSMQGYEYCDLLIGKGCWALACHRATETLNCFERDYPLLSKALDKLTIGRASLGLVLVVGSDRVPRRGSQTARSHLDQAVDGLRGAGTTDQTPRGLLARAAFRRSIGDWEGATSDLDEVEEIAEPGPMRLFLCDMALERARLAFARIEAFAPLNGMLEGGNPPKPELSSAEKIAKLKEEAAKQINIAADYIEAAAITGATRVGRAAGRAARRAQVRRFAAAGVIFSFRDARETRGPGIQGCRRGAAVSPWIPGSLACARAPE